MLLCLNRRRRRQAGGEEELDEGILEYQRESKSSGLGRKQRCKARQSQLDGERSTGSHRAAFEDNVAAAVGRRGDGERYCRGRRGKQTGKGCESEQLSWKVGEREAASSYRNV